MAPVTVFQNRRKAVIVSCHPRFQRRALPSPRMDGEETGFRPKSLTFNPPPPCNRARACTILTAIIDTALNPLLPPPQLASVLHMVHTTRDTSDSTVHISTYRVYMERSTCHARGVLSCMPYGNVRRPQSSGVLAATSPVQHTY